MRRTILSILSVLIALCVGSTSRAQEKEGAKTELDTAKVEDALKAAGGPSLRFQFNDNTHKFVQLALMNFKSEAENVVFSKSVTKNSVLAFLKIAANEKCSLKDIEDDLTVTLPFAGQPVKSEEKKEASKCHVSSRDDADAGKGAKIKTATSTGFFDAPFKDGFTGNEGQRKELEEDADKAKAFPSKGEFKLTETRGAFYFVKTEDGGLIVFAGANDSGAGITADSGSITHASPAIARFTPNLAAKDFTEEKCCHTAAFSFDVMPEIRVEFHDRSISSAFEERANITFKMILHAETSGCRNRQEAGAAPFTADITKEVKLENLTVSGTPIKRSGKVTVTETSIINGVKIVKGPTTVDAVFKFPGSK